MIRLMISVHIVLSLLLSELCLLLRLKKTAARQKEAGENLLLARIVCGAKSLNMSCNQRYEGSFLLHRVYGCEIEWSYVLYLASTPVGIRSCALVITPLVTIGPGLREKFLLR